MPRAPPGHCSTRALGGTRRRLTTDINDGRSLAVELKKLFRSAEEYIATGLKWISWITATAAAFGFVLSFFKWGNKGPFLYLKDNLQSIWMWAITAVSLLLVIWTTLLRRRFKGGFRDKFKNNLQANWDFQGIWRIPEKGTLLVTGPDDGGGITKVGAHWENYTLTFKARIIRDCLGVIIRAQDLNNYFMFQVRTDKIRPHRRVAVPMAPVQIQQTTGATPQIQPIQFSVGWQIFDPPTPLNRTLDTWFSFKITARGESVCIRIDDEIVLQAESFLKIPTGKIGFRNAGSEEALVKNVKVVLEP